jgi:hypothetical protein
MRLIYLKINIVFLSFILFFFPISLRAASFFFETESQLIKPESYFKVELFFDPKGKEVNSLEGEIVLPAGLEVKEILEGDSIVPFWIKKPSLEDGKVVFSGLIPGGFRGVLGAFHEGYKPGKVLTLILKSREEKEIEITLQEIKVLLNDGKGTELESEIKPLKITISQKAPEVFGVLPIKDLDKPESFQPLISKDPNIFGGKWFLVFVTQDKGSGIDHYEVLESKKQKIEEGKWLRAESPYLLEDQSLSSYIFVKAVDKAGNERIETIPPTNYSPSSSNPFFLVIIILIGLIIILIARRIFFLKSNFKRKE